MRHAIDYNPLIIIVTILVQLTYVSVVEWLARLTAV